MTAAALAGAAAMPASAATFSGTVNGVFSDAVTAGTIIESGLSLAFVDNTGTADFSFPSVSPSDNSLTWGNSGAGSTPANTSVLNFKGVTFVNQPANQTFKLGTITFFNGSSRTDSVIFGGTLTFDLGLLGGVKSTFIDIRTTQNTGLSQNRDADFIAFSDFPQTFNVFENATASADLFGRIDSGSNTLVTTIRNTPGSTGGFIGIGVGGVPEPASWAMLIVGFGMVGAAARRRTAVVI